MAPRSVRSGSDRTTLVGHRKGDQKLIRVPPCFVILVKPLVPVAFAVVGNQSALGQRDGLWPVLLIYGP
jgi:hypothetical protein